MKLVRKIDRGKWERGSLETLEQFSADAITNCMKTKGNTISTWAIKQDDPAERANAVLAMASTFTSLDTIHVVILDASHVESSGLRLEQTSGNTPVTELEDTHRDIVNLTYGSLGILATLIAKCITDKHVQRFTKKELRHILVSAVQSGKVELDKLHERVQRKLEGHLNQDN